MSIPRLTKLRTSDRTDAATGYYRYFNGLRDYLSSQPSVASKIRLVPKEDTWITGNFEVTVKSTGQVLHSKRHAGQGKAQSMKEREAILQQIVEVLEEMGEL